MLKAHLVVYLAVWLVKAGVPRTADAESRRARAADLNMSTKASGRLGWLTLTLSLTLTNRR